jgi:tRNA modification GTPase
MNPADTIVAVSSAVGAAARMIVRLSGPRALDLTAEVSRLSPDALPSGAETRACLHFASVSLPASLYVFRATRSYTGDDVVEFHLPGNPLLARMLLDYLYAAGARPSDPGEFTARAFFNGRLDLAEAEGVAATIAAGNEQELSAARQLMAGELARRLRPAMDSVAEALALVEAGIDFADEEGVTFLSPQQLRERLAAADAALARLLEDSTRFERLAHEPTAVLVGRPNAGKSTLLNALAEESRAVTSPVAGTTRDALSAEVALPRGIVRVFDVAGLQEIQPALPRQGEVERQMRERALNVMTSADLVVVVRDATDPSPPVKLGRPHDLTVLTKLDLIPAHRPPSPGTPGEGRGEGSSSSIQNPQFEMRNEEHPHPNPLPEYRERGQVSLGVSAVTGEGLDHLLARLDRLAFGDPVSAGGASLALNARHVDAVREARLALARAAAVGDAASPEVVALELREALDALGRVLGSVSPDDLLGRIFSTFCIGK